MPLKLIYFGMQTITSGQIIPLLEEQCNDVPMLLYVTSIFPAGNTWLRFFKNTSADFLF